MKPLLCKKWNGEKFSFGINICAHDGRAVADVKVYFIGHTEIEEQLSQLWKQGVKIVKVEV